MDTNAAKNYLQNTELKFKLKAGATVLPAVFLLAIVLIETVTGKALGSAGDVYFATGLILLVITGSVLNLIKYALAAFKWGWLLTPFMLFDLIIALCAGLMVFTVGALFPFIPMALDTFSLYRERCKAKEYL